MFISAPQSLPHMSAETSLTGPTWRAQGGQRYARVRLHRTGQSRCGGFLPARPAAPLQSTPTVVAEAPGRQACLLPPHTL